ncbi:MAG: intradiol ring-cleavage dioxygenase [Candidatus Rokuibacteriota bacterium]|nr:MAG: intradiol ring-cleavage dioxygenase [Candidatus Rokubacteria bacterium]
MPSRRDFVRLTLGTSAAVALGAVAAGAQSPRPATPACGADTAPTPAQTEGPYFKRSSPERASLLEPALTGSRLVVTGLVLGTDCRPVPHALLDFWQADGSGHYDNAGQRLRGHQFTDAEGRYRLETVLPGLYPGRTRHIHVKAQAPGQRVLTTQLYFPGEIMNARDGIFDQTLVVAMADSATARFDFVLQTGGRG